MDESCSCCDTTKAYAQKPTLLHALFENVIQQPNRVFCRWLDKDCNVVKELSYGQLWSGALKIKKFILLKVRPGDRIMLAYPFGLDFLEALMGCMLAGVIPCSVYPPNPYGGKHSFDQFNSQAKDAEATFGMTTGNFVRILRLASVKGLKTHVKWLASDKIKPSPADNQQVRMAVKYDLPQPNDVAFIQYTSGSTSDPKGVILTHKSIAHNVWTGVSVLATGYDCRAVSWLPQYHDFGLSLYLGAMYSNRVEIYGFSPLDFIKNPLMWADVIDKYRATSLCGPNFAFGLLAKRMKAANRHLRHSKDLKLAMVGAEPIAPVTLQAMERDIGIPAQIIMPSYGMAETCVYATSCMGDDVRIIDGVVSCGSLKVNEAFGKQLVVADSTNGKICDEGMVGEIYMRGPDLASGYWAKPDLDERFHCVLSDGLEYFATGDLGKILEGRLFVVGRVKELIIINGRNVYPTDIERTIETAYSSIVRPGSTVAFQLSGTEVGLVLELRDKIKEGGNEIRFEADQIRTLINTAHGVHAGEIIALKKGSVPKTTSGKVRRVESKNMTLERKWPLRSIRWSWSAAPAEKLGTPSKLSGTDGASSTFESVLTNVLGSSINMNKSWEENGLTSLSQISLSNQIAAELGVTLPARFDEEFSTPQQLKQFVEAQTAPAFPIDETRLDQFKIPFQDEGRFGPMIAAALQAFGVVLLLATFGVCLLSSFVVGKLTVGTQEIIFFDNRYFWWSWCPLILPTFMASLSLLTIAIKWIVIGRYRSTEVHIRPRVSMLFLRWWFVDRAMHIWEFWVGRFFMETPLIWLFYTLMGAKIHPTATISASIREFDLVTIGRNSKINHRIRCRKFSSWDSDRGASLRFRPIVVGEKCRVSGMVSLGATLGNECHVADLSVIQECAQVGNGCVAEGNPARKVASVEDDSLSDDESCTEISLFGLIKLVWLVIEMYQFHALLLVAQIMWNDRLPSTWRYTPLTYWVVLLLTVSLLSILLSALLKALLIGNRLPRDNDSFVNRVTTWMCDYHFRVSTGLLNTLFCNSRFWSLILFLHGVDIDLQSSIDLDSFKPSNMNAVRIRQSFVSTAVSFQATKEGKKTEIINSSLGYFAKLRPGIRIENSLVRPMISVQDSLYGDASSIDFARDGTVSILRELLFAVWCFVLLGSFVPAFELFMAIVMRAQTLWVAFAGLVGCLVVQTLVGLIVIRLYYGMLSMAKRRKQVHQALEHTIISIVWGIRLWTFWTLLAGTPLYNWTIRFLGCRIEGDLVFLGDALYDFPAISFLDKTIVDEAMVLGHQQVFSELTIKPTTIGGVLHQGTFPLPGSTLKTGGTEQGPWRTIVQISEEAAAIDLERSDEASVHDDIP